MTIESAIHLFRILSYDAPRIERLIQKWTAWAKQRTEHLYEDNEQEDKSNIIESEVLTEITAEAGDRWNGRHPQGDATT